MPTTTEPVGDVVGRRVAHRHRPERALNPGPAPARRGPLGWTRPASRFAPVSIRRFAGLAVNLSRGRRSPRPRTVTVGTVTRKHPGIGHRDVVQPHLGPVVVVLRRSRVWQATAKAIGEDEGGQERQLSSSPPVRARPTRPAIEAGRATIRRSYPASRDLERRAVLGADGALGRQLARVDRGSARTRTAASAQGRCRCPRCVWPGPV